MDGSFWRKRVASALVALGLALLALQFLPHLPEDQTLVFLPPEGASLVSLELSYIDDQGQMLAGATLRPSEAAPAVAHTLRLPSGPYDVLARAIVSRAGQRQTLLERRPLVLEGGSQKVFLEPPSSPPRP